MLSFSSRDLRASLPLVIKYVPYTPTPTHPNTSARVHMRACTRATISLCSLNMRILSTIAKNIMENKIHIFKKKKNKEKRKMIHTKSTYLPSTMIHFQLMSSY